MADINLDRSGEVNWTGRRGDTFAPAPVEFIIDNEPEVFAGSSVKAQIRKNGAFVLELTEGDGIAIQVNKIQYSIPASVTAQLAPGMYEYDVQKTTDTIVATIQYGTIKLTQDKTI